MFVPATISGYSAGLIQQAGTATKEQLPDHAGYCLAMATRNRFSGSMTWSHPGRGVRQSAGCGHHGRRQDRRRPLSSRPYRWPGTCRSRSCVRPATWDTRRHRRLLGLLRVGHARACRVDDSLVDDLTEACLRLLGVGATNARRLAGVLIPAAETARRSARPRDYTARRDVARAMMAPVTAPMTTSPG
jgi:hypothetical protein